MTSLSNPVNPERGAFSMENCIEDAGKRLAEALAAAATDGRLSGREVAA